MGADRGPGVRLHRRVTVAGRPYVAPGGGSTPVTVAATLVGGQGDQYSAGSPSHFTTDLTANPLAGDFGASLYDLEMGLLFRSLAIPPGTAFTSATVTIRSHQVQGTMPNLVIEAVAADTVASPPANRAAALALPRTVANVPWTPPGTWSTSGTAIVTPDLSALFNEVVQRPGWVSGNNLLIIVRAATAGYGGSQSNVVARSWFYATNNTNAPTLAGSGTV